MLGGALVSKSTVCDWNESLGAIANKPCITKRSLIHYLKAMAGRCMRLYMWFKCASQWRGSLLYILFHCIGTKLDYVLLNVRATQVNEVMQKMATKCMLCFVNFC